MSLPLKLKLMLTIPPSLAPPHEIDYEVEIELPTGTMTLVYTFLYAVDPADMSEYKDPGS